MDTKTILESIDGEISRLQMARTILAGGNNDGWKATAESRLTHRGPGRPKGSGMTGIKSAPRKARRTISAEGRKRIADAQKARWASSKKKVA